MHGENPKRRVSLLIHAPPAGGTKHGEARMGVRLSSQEDAAWSTDEETKTQEDEASRRITSRTSDKAAAPQNNKCPLEWESEFSFNVFLPLQSEPPALLRDHTEKLLLMSNHSRPIHFLITLSVPHSISCASLFHFAPPGLCSQGQAPLSGCFPPRGSPSRPLPVSFSVQKQSNVPHLLSVPTAAETVHLNLLIEGKSLEWKPHFKWNTWRQDTSASHCSTVLV